MGLVQCMMHSFLHNHDVNIPVRYACYLIPIVSYSIDRGNMLNGHEVTGVLTVVQIWHVESHAVGLFGCIPINDVVKIL